MDFFGDPRTMSGRELLQAGIDGGMQVPIGATLGFQLVEVGDGRVVFEGEPSLKVYNPLGSVHGGYAAALLDSACGCAVHAALPAGQTYTTLELKISLHRGMSENTGLVRCEGKILTVGRRVGFSEARLTDSAGRLLASATSTLLIFAIEDAARPRGS